MTSTRSPSISSPVHIRILSALTRYKYLTRGQIVRLGSDEKTVRTRLGDLRTANMIDCQEFRFGPSMGRLPHLYWLKEKGGKHLAELLDEPPAAVARGHMVEASHAWHRILMVDTLIAADQWAEASGQSEVAFSTYMQRRKDGSPTALTLGNKQAEADGILRLKDTAGHDRVYVVEVYCSRYKEGKSSFAVDQLEPYALAGGQAFDEQLRIPKDGKAARVLVVCDTAELRDRLLRILPTRDGMPPLDAMTWQRLHFKAAEELADFGTGWHRVGGEVVNLPV